MEEYAFYSNFLYNNIAVKLKSWWLNIDKSRDGNNFYKKMSYFSHECLNVNLIDER